MIKCESLEMIRQHFIVSFVPLQNKKAGTAGCVKKGNLHVIYSVINCQSIYSSTSIKNIS